MRYGHFSEDAREFIIERPDTPSPWMNYISNGRGFCGIVSQTGGGFCFHRDPRERRITKYRYNAVPVDRPGRYFYIRDMETGEYWSPTWQPVRVKPDSFECRHGQGYTLIRSDVRGLRHQVRYFVPSDSDCEVWDLTITNLSDRARKLSVIPYCEFTFWSEPESRNIQWSLHLTRCSFEDGLILYNFIEPHPAFDMHANRNYAGDRPGYAFMGVNRPVLDYDCVRDAFLGMYRSESDPIGIESGRLSNSLLRGGVACAALRTGIDLAPGDSATVTVTMGYAESAGEAGRLRHRFSDPARVDAGLAAVCAEWDRHLSVFRLESPDKDLETMVNVWNAYQCKTTFDWSRYISFYENGEGRGMGTRDSCQDTLAICAQLPDRVKARILQILSTTQFETGDCYHQFFPLGGKGDLKGFSDDHLWLIQMVYAYISETGDTKILDERAAYADSRKSATVYRHLAAALGYTARMTGPRGLPLILTADWNDTLHLWMECEKPESVLTAELYVHALKLMAELASLTNRSADVRRYRSQAGAMADLINRICWDGEWYLRGFGSEVIGTKESRFAKIFLNTQTWAVLSGVAQADRAKTCMDSVRRLLASDEGIKLLSPTFTEYDQTYGLISRYVPGRKENGIFSHANSWAIAAEAVLGRPEVAMDYYKKILPMSRNDRAEILKTEPYVFCQTIASEDAHNKGEGGNSWLTGTASWMYVAATQYLLGIRPVPGGLRIRPSVPDSWSGFTVKRTFRGCDYTIRFRKTGSRSVTADGVRLTGDIVPPAALPRSEILVEY